jgi:molybdopterin/thiamine biosynthesis adenylyltransferase
MNPAQLEKYSRQILFGEIGESGQERLLSGSAVIVGCGALGTVAAGLLVRAGVGRIRIIDRDFVEHSNLQRQTLFEEQDAKDALPKAVAAERRLRAINSDVAVEGIVADLTPENATEMLSGFSVILDGTDNFETRLLVNDAAISMNIPWIYAAAVGSYGVTMTVRPGGTACLACLLEDRENVTESGLEDTCDTTGVLGAAVGVEALNRKLVCCDVWKGKFQSVGIRRNPDCRACGRHEFVYLDGSAQPEITMCGRNSVQIHERGRKLDLGALGRRLSSDVNGKVRNNEFLLRFQVDPYEMTIFADGRAVIKGTKDPAVARSLYSRYIGS